MASPNVVPDYLFRIHADNPIVDMPHGAPISSALPSYPFDGKQRNVSCGFGMHAVVCGSTDSDVVGHTVEEKQPCRLHFEILLTGDGYPLGQLVTHLVEHAMRLYPAGCEITITTRA